MFYLNLYSDPLKVIGWGGWPRGLSFSLFWFDLGLDWDLASGLSKIQSLKASVKSSKRPGWSYHLYNLKMHHLSSGVQNGNARWTDSADSHRLAPCCCCCWHLRVLSAVSGSGLHQPPTTTSHNPVSGPVWRSHSPQTTQGQHQSEHWKHETDQWETRQPRTWSIQKAAILPIILPLINQWLD